MKNPLLFSVDLLKFADVLLMMPSACRLSQFKNAGFLSFLSVGHLSDHETLTEET